MLIVPDSMRYAITSTGGRALTVTGDNSVWAEPFDEDGQKQPPSQIAPTGPGIGHVAVTRAGGVALVAWSEGPSGAYKILRVRPVSFDGKPLGPPLVASTLPFIGNLRVVGTPAGALIAFEAEKPGTLTQVFAVRLVCH